MSLIINPGSHIGESGEGWTNTYEKARLEAERWLRLMMEGDGIQDVELLDEAEPVDEGTRWSFQFRHTVTGKTVTLETHGIDDVEAYRKQHIFDPRVYWNGSSTGGPEIEHWLTDGFEVVKTLRASSSNGGDN